MKSALKALEQLREGNRRFASDTLTQAGHYGETRRNELTEGQEPFAIILGCSDSRVPAEFVFDQGLGDLFVIRIAGNIVAPSQIGSVELAAALFGTHLVVVLGHSQCGAIHAAIDELDNPEKLHSKGLNPIVDRIKPTIQHLVSGENNLGAEALVAKAVRANVRASVKQLRSGSATIESLIRTEELMVVGAEYSLETGIVDFFDGAPPTE